MKSYQISVSSSCSSPRSPTICWKCPPGWVSITSDLIHPKHNSAPYLSPLPPDQITSLQLVNFRWCLTVIQAANHFTSFLGPPKHFFRPAQLFASRLASLSLAPHPNFILWTLAKSSENTTVTTSFYCSTLSRWKNGTCNLVKIPVHVLLSSPVIFKPQSNDSPPSPHHYSWCIRDF